MDLMKTVQVMQSFCNWRSSQHNDDRRYKHASLMRALLLFTLTLCLFVLPAIAKDSQPTTIPIQSTVTAPQQLFEQGAALYQSGQFAEAASAFQKAAKFYQTQGDRLKRAATLSNLSLAYQQLGQWQDAKAAIEESLMLLNGQQKPSAQSSKLNLELLAQAFDIQAGLQLATGQSDRALATWQQATTLYTQLNDKTGVFRSRINQAKTLQIKGFYRRALDVLNEINQVLALQPDSLTKAVALRSLGDTLQLTGDLNLARQVLQQSLAIAQHLPDPEALSAAYLSLGNTARAQKDVPTAIEFYQKAIANSANPLAKVQAQSNYLSLLVESGQAKNALEAIQLAEKIQLSSLPPNQDSLFAKINYAQTIIQLMGKAKTNQLIASSTSRLTQTVIALLSQTIQQAKDLQDQAAEAYALGTLGHLYEQTQQWSQAQQLTEQALQQIQPLNAPEITYRYLWQLGRLLVAQNNLPRAKTAYEGAITTLKTLRSDLVATNRETQFNFRDGVEPIYREAVALLFTIEKIDPNEANLNQARQLIEALQLAELDNFFRAACVDFKSVSLDKVVDQGDPTAAVIYPIILEQELQVIVKIPKQPLRHYATHKPRSEIEGVLRQLREQLVDEDTIKKTQALGKEVYTWLIQPIAAELQQAEIKTLVFVLDGALRNVPMGALYDGKQYLIEQHAVALNLGLQLPESRTITLKAIAAGLADPSPALQERYHFGSLPAIKTELSLIQQAGVETRILLDQTFKKETLQQAVRSQPSSIVHLATHGKFSSKAEETFVLTADGPMNVDEFETLLRVRGQTRAESIELLVLSACQTAAGDERATLGLAGVAFRAGARSTLASLWQVDDRATALLMGEFYRELAQAKVTKAEALRRAQLTLLSGKFSEENPRYFRPLYWAAYTLVGNWL
ncbi:MAG: CHAT domain-containing protein [Leptolyngbya sp. BL-A-14]